MLDFSPELTEEEEEADDVYTDGTSVMGKWE